jgi:hypothetical protein
MAGSSQQLTLVKRRAAPMVLPSKSPLVDPERTSENDGRWEQMTL